MNLALWAAKTGLDAQNTRMAVIANNLANTNTTGFKAGRPAFQDLMYQNIRQVGAQSTQNTQYTTGLTLGTGVRIVATEKDYTQGSVSQTGNSLDLTVNGRGFLQITMPDGTIAYTRDGSFTLDNQGNVVTASGYPLQPAINVPQGATSLTIGNDGVVTITTATNTKGTQVGQIQLADFINEEGLQPVGNNLVVESAASGSPQVGTAGTNGLGTIQQGALETSNVNSVTELVSMIECQRSYEMNSKAISTTDQMLQYLTTNLS
ncbi:MAG TPA: flagellar basal-body rod protein FlgG [Steroidobacteraceae bacterium]|jgi:flagellar basal-body rod protein FlgG|nr:flagellar basal-body rod protein FlgG [Steroidobacteraceae bacterium]